MHIGAPATGLRKNRANHRYPKPIKQGGKVRSLVTSKETGKSVWKTEKGGGLGKKAEKKKKRGKHRRKRGGKVRRRLNHEEKERWEGRV